MVMVIGSQLLLILSCLFMYYSNTAQLLSKMEGWSIITPHPPKWSPRTSYIQYYVLQQNIKTSCVAPPQHLIRKENPKDNKIIIFIRVTAFNFPRTFHGQTGNCWNIWRKVCFFSFRYGIDNLSVTRSHKLFVSFINFRVRLEHLSGARACYGSWRARLWCSRRDN